MHKGYKISLIDLFSGTGGFARGLQEAGFETIEHFFSEKDKSAISNYQYNYEEAKHIGSVEHVGRVATTHRTILTMGSPCQDFSICGKRQGLGGEKSSLIREGIRVIAENKPDVFIWENVRGIFSSNGGADFFQILQWIRDMRCYDCEWQLVNTGWFLPQNRERLYFVGHLRGRSEPGVFSFTENDSIFIRMQQEKPAIIRTLMAGGGGLHRNMTLIRRAHGYNKGGESDICPTIRSSSFQHNVHLKGHDGIRRLTEIECERLQGFPDNWTKYGINGKIIPKTQRYKMMGNAVSVPVVKAIAERLIFL